MIDDFFSRAAASLLLAIAVFFALPSEGLLAQSNDDQLVVDPSLAQAQRETQSREVLQSRLTEIHENIQVRNSELRQLSAATPGVGVAEDFSTSADIEERITELRAEIDDLRRRFEDLSTGGADKLVFEDAPAAMFDWQAELVEIARPIFDELKNLTERPRQIEEPRREIARGHMRVTTAERALEALARVAGFDLASPVRERAGRLKSDWERRLVEASQAVEVSELQLSALQNDDAPVLERLQRSILDFLSGRGLTAAIAFGAALAVWLIFRALRNVVEYQAKRKRGERHAGTKFRLFLYAHRLISLAAIAIVLVVTFSVLGDFLLLTLTLIAIALVLLWLRRVLPAFIEEGQLLLGIGNVREGERIVYDGLPYEVLSINVYSYLRNPHLDGVVRLPIHALTGLNSRPAKEEPWFPARAGDYVFLAGDVFGQVVQLTQNFIKLNIRGGMEMLVPTQDFMTQAVQNISSGSTYLVPVTFGIDYAHQALLPQDVAGRFARAVEKALAQESFASDVVSVTADFQEANASSLDYLVLVTMKSVAASSFFAVGRKVKGACVAVCNEEGWGIPFAQMQIHYEAGAPSEVSG